MTAPTRSNLVLFDAQVTPGSTTKATAIAASTPAGGNGGWFDISGYNGGDIGWSLTNSGSAPSPSVQFIIQFAYDKTAAKSIYDRWSATGDGTPGSNNSGIVPIPTSAKWVRVLAFGNGTNAVSVFVEAMLKA